MLFPISLFVGVFVPWATSEADVQAAGVSFTSVLYPGLCCLLALMNDGSHYREPMLPATSWP